MPMDLRWGGMKPIVYKEGWLWVVVRLAGALRFDLGRGYGAYVAMARCVLAAGSTEAQRERGCCGDWPPRRNRCRGTPHLRRRSSAETDKEISGRTEG